MAVPQAHRPPELEGTRGRAVFLDDLGLCDYNDAYRLQQETVAKVKENPAAFERLFFVEHPEVYTLGRRSSAQDMDVAFPTVSVERGGQVTFHNPGQLVAYPILRLVDKERDLHLYLRNLEQVLIDVLADFGLDAERRPGATGVWLKGVEKKIASIGVAVTGWVTYHGIALNVNNDLSGFAKIRPCGFPSEVMTSMSVELRENAPTMDEVKESFLRHFLLNFNRSLVL